MRNRPALSNPRYLPWLICLGLLAALVLPFASWLVWSFGLPVGSLFSSEGLRWLALHAIAECFNRTLAVSVLAASAFGVWQQALCHPTIPSVRRHAIVGCIVVSLFMLCIALLAALHPESPLLSINGTLYHSAYSRGFLPYLTLCLTMLGVVYAFIVGLVRSLSRLVEVLVYGVCRFILWLFLVLVLQFDLACVWYMMEM